MIFDISYAENFLDGAFAGSPCFKLISEQISADSWQHAVDLSIVRLERQVFSEWYPRSVSVRRGDRVIIATIPAADSTRRYFVGFVESCCGMPVSHFHGYAIDEADCLETARQRAARTARLLNLPAARVRIPALDQSLVVLTVDRDAVVLSSELIPKPEA